VGERARFDVIGIGNAIVDVIFQTDDAFLATHGIAKGGMTLIDTARAEQLYAAMGAGRESSGGSAANTMAGLASLGSKAAFIGTVADDSLGKVFRDDLTAIGVHYATPPLTLSAPTARCLIMVTPDAERSMNTFLGASVELGPEAIEPALIESASVTYLEGYLWDPPRAKEAFKAAALAAHHGGRKVALSLSDAFCVERHRDDFLVLIENSVDILFANESELIALARTADIFDAVADVRRRCPTLVVTRGEKGAVIAPRGGAALELPSVPVAKVVDTTGAGDLYAAGFLAGYTRALPLAACGRMGAIAAAEVISHVGARPARPLSELIDAR